MIKRDDFQIGQRVTLTEEARKWGLYRHHEGPVSGTVRGFGRSVHLVRVQVDGRKSVDSFHVAFWAAEDTP